MLIVWAVLWLAALLLLLMNRGSPVFRWLSLVAFSGGMGAIASVMEGWIVPLESYPPTIDEARKLRIVQRACSWTSYYGLPYGFLLFAARYHANAITDRLRLKRLLPYFAIAPPLAMLALPIEDGFPVPYVPLACWALPYALIGTILIVTKQATHPAERRAHMIVTAAVLPAVLFAMAMNYMMPLFGVYRMWRYNVWSIPVAFLIFIISLFKYGFLGVQLMIERRRLDYSMRAITSGTAMMNHAIKNDIAKIKLFTDKISRAGADEAALREDAAVIARSAEHIEAMIRGVHERTQELVLRPARFDLGALVRGQVHGIAPAAKFAGVEVMLHIADEACPIETVADPAQTEEALHNVLKNSLEAMPGGGVLTVAVTGVKRGALIEVTDTGHGIEKQYLSKVTEPFFTTKSGKAMNFGLGLAYCSQLMNRQGGELRIRSERGRGTTVTFAFASVKRLAKRSALDSGVRVQATGMENGRGAGIDE